MRGRAGKAAVPGSGRPSRAPRDTARAPLLRSLHRREARGLLEGPGRAGPPTPGSLSLAKATLRPEAQVGWEAQPRLCSRQTPPRWAGPPGETQEGVC